MSDQPTESLFEFDDGFGGLVIAERVTATFADGVESSFEQWVVGDAERQAGNDDVLQGITRDIDALPEAVCSEQDGAFVGFEFFEHC